MGELVVSVIELFASVALPKISLPCFLVLRPFPIEGPASRTAGRLFELPSDRMVPILWKPYGISVLYDPS